MVKLALLILLSVQIASAQTTWKGLRFGMTEAEVRKEYPASFEKKNIERGQFALLDRDQRLDGSNATAELFFDKGGKLEQIDLSLQNDPKVGEADLSTLGSSIAVISTVVEKLVEKYGTATSLEGTCDVSSVLGQRSRYPNITIFNCNGLWRAAGQTINMYGSIKDNRVSSLDIEYKPLASDI